MLTLVPGAMGGSESYTRALCRALAAQPDVSAVAFVADSGHAAGEGLETRFVPEYLSGTSTATKISGMAVGVVRRRSIRRRFAGIDVVHYPFTVPIPSLPVPSVITLHDLQHRDLPAMFSRRTQLFRRLAYDNAAQRADVVVVPSEFVRDRAESVLGLNAGRVMAVPHGVDHSVFSPSPSGAAREPFVLYPARVWPHKNHPRLLTAFELLRRMRPEMTLVLTGSGTEAFASASWIQTRGVVTELELVDLYRRAACLVFPSLYEGFGAPVLEAMACGAPVAASNVSSLPEVCGDAAVLFDPKSPHSIANGISAALDRSDELSRLGLTRAAGFSWAASAEGHLRAYRLASGL